MIYIFFYFDLFIEKMRIPTKCVTVSTFVVDSSAQHLVLLEPALLTSSRNSDRYVSSFDIRVLLTEITCIEMCRSCCCC